MIRDAHAAAARTLRPLLRDPWFAGWVVLSLTVSLGTVASVFSIADRLLLRPPAGVADAGRVGRLSARAVSPSSGTTFDQTAFSYPAFQAARGRAGTRLDLAAFTDPGPGELVLDGAWADARLSFASGGYFRVLGVRAARGALFAEADDQPAAPPVAVLSEPFARRLAPEPGSLVGRAVRLDGRFYTVVGIAGGAFTGTELVATDVWVPLRAAGDQAFGPRWTSDPGIYPLTVVGRRAPGVAPALASQLALAGLAAEPAPDAGAPRYLAGALSPLRAARGPSQARQAMLTLWLAATALAILLAASINTATLYLARGRRRARNLAVCMALGATRGRIVRTLVAEALVLTALGTALGLFVAQWTSAALRTLVLPRTGRDDALVDLRVAAVTASLALAVALGSSVVPALRASSIDPATCVRDAPAAHQGGGRAWRFVLHTLQAALSAALLVATGLFLRSSFLAQRLELGFEPRSLYAVTAEHVPAPVQPAAVDQAFARLRERLAAAPGVAGVSVASAAPMVSSGVALIYADGAAEGAAGTLEGPFVAAVDRDFLAVTGTRLVRGHGVEAAEEAGGALVNRSAAARLWPGRDPLGRCLRLGEPGARCMPVVGVTEDAVRRAITDPPGFQVYVPLAADVGGERLLLVRLANGRADGAAVLRPFLAEAFPASVVPRVRSIERTAASQSALWRSGAALFTALGVLMVLLAALGLYGSLSYLASTRSYEFGIRLAFGARPHTIALSFVRFGLLVTAAGLVAGLALLRIGQPFLQPLLFETSVFDPWVIGASTLLLGLVALVATARPALEAARTDPMSLLRGG